MESLGKGVGWMAGWMMGEQTAFQQDQDQERDHRGRGDPDRLSLLTQNLKYFLDISGIPCAMARPRSDHRRDPSGENPRTQASPCHAMPCFLRLREAHKHMDGVSSFDRRCSSRIASVPIPAAFEHCTSVSRLSTASRLRPGLFLRLRQDLPTQPLYVCIGLPRRAWATDPQDAAAWSPADILQTQRCSVGGSIRGEKLKL